MAVRTKPQVVTWVPPVRTPVVLAYVLGSCPVSLFGEETATERPVWELEFESAFRLSWVRVWDQLVSETTLTVKR